MEMNQNSVQEQPAQDIIPTPEQSENRVAAVTNAASQSETAQSSTALEQTLEYTYNPAKAAHITDVLRELLDPEYILLFGKMAGRTPHSDTLTYDLLVITADPPRYNWYDAKRYLKMKIPSIGHGAPYMNIYIHTLHDVESNYGPFIYLARREGIVLYRSHRRKYTRPKGNFDFGHAASAASKYMDAFLPQADRLVGYAEQRIAWEYLRESAFAMAQAAVYYYRTLFYVYHGMEADTCDVQILHHRLHTLSGELPLLFEANEFQSIRTLHCLNRFLANARYDPKFFIMPGELIQHLDRVRKLGKVVTDLCKKRIALYEKRAQ